MWDSPHLKMQQIHDRMSDGCWKVFSVYFFLGKLLFYTTFCIKNKNICLPGILSHEKFSFSWWNKVVTEDTQYLFTLFWTWMKLEKSISFTIFFSNQVYVLVWIMQLSIFLNNSSTWEWTKTELGAAFLAKTNKPAIDLFHSRILFLCMEFTWFVWVKVFFMNTNVNCLFIKI